MVLPSHLIRLYVIASDEDYKTRFPVISLLRCKVSSNLGNRQIPFPGGYRPDEVISPRRVELNSVEASRCSRVRCMR